MGPFERLVESLAESKLKVYRGTGPEGLKSMRPSDEGVLGPGIYFYDNLEDAKAFAEPGGGVIVGEVDTHNPNVVVGPLKPVHMAGTSFVLRNYRVVVAKGPDDVKIVQRLKGV